MEEGNIGRGNFLPADNHACSDTRHLSVGKVRAAHLRTSNSIVQTFQELNHLRVEVVLVLVEVNERVASIGNVVIERDGR